MICVSQDTSVYFEESDMEFQSGYTISLGGNWRYLIEVSYKTGRCEEFSCFLEGADVLEKGLRIPKHREGGLYFVDDEEMTRGSGTMYFPFENKCYYDVNSGILCVGNPYLEGEVIEFASNTFAAVFDNKLTAVFMYAPCLKEMIAVHKGIFRAVFE